MDTMLGVYQKKTNKITNILSSEFINNIVCTDYNYLAIPLVQAHHLLLFSFIVKSCQKF